VFENGERDVSGCVEAMLSGRDGTVGTPKSVDVAERVGTDGAGSKTAAVAPARSQGFGGDPILIKILVSCVYEWFTCNGMYLMF
jgi:hypothetical protein